MTTVALTGHRPEKIHSPEIAHDEASLFLSKVNKPVVISGMAAGFDLIGAEAALDLEIPVIAAVPWLGHKPRKDDRDRYDHILKNAMEIVYVVDTLPFPGKWVYQKRNEWMVDKADVVLAYFDGSPGGTKNCIDYALKTKVPVAVIEPGHSRLKWL